MAKRYANPKQSALVKKIRAVDYNVRRRLARVEALASETIAGTPIKKYANEEYNRKIKGRMKDIRNLTYPQLQALYVDLQNVNNMESSTVKGYQTMYKDFKPILEKILKASPEAKAKASRVLELLQQRFGSLYEYFKYHAMDYVYDEATNNMDEVQIAENLTEIYDEFLSWDGVDTGDDFIELYGPPTDNEREYQSTYKDW